MKSGMGLLPDSVSYLFVCFSPVFAEHVASASCIHKDILAYSYLSAQNTLSFYLMGDSRAVNCLGRAFPKMM